MTSAERIAERYLEKASRGKTAGEVRFIKDRGNDGKAWGWGPSGPSERGIGEFKYEAKNRKPLAETLRATLAALGHVQSAHNIFIKLKGTTVSPDGNLGGKGYIAKISEMRRQYMNCSEALSALVDTLYDEVNAPHWDPTITKQSPRERDEVQDIMEDVEEIKQDPEGWASEEEDEMDEEPEGKASQAKTAAIRVASRYIQRGQDE